MSRRNQQDQTICALCLRELPLTFHHLIPRLTHKKKWVKAQFAERLQDGIWVCRSCHSAIHRFIPHVDLARTYHTLDALFQHEELGKYVRWSQTQRRVKKVRGKR
jgi:hypothetical protein